MDDSVTAPPGIDISRPSTARVYDFFLGGAHNFAVDRELAAQIQRTTPNVATTMRANRAFLRRAVRYLAGEGIRQYLDLGSGIPTVGNVHEVAQQVAPESTVVYVDIDSVAVAHSTAILTGNDRAAILRGDLREPAKVLADVYALNLLDFTRPIAVLLAGVLHYVGDEYDPAAIVAELRDAVPAGSHLLVSHATLDHQPAEMRQAQRLSSRMDNELRPRAHAEVAAYFDGLDLIEPGLVFIPLWRPEPDTPVEHPEQVGGYAGVGRKP